MHFSEENYAFPFREIRDIFRKALRLIMSDDTFTEVSHSGWLSRIGKSITGALVGLIMTIAAFPLLWWNEGRSVQTFQGLIEGEKSCVEASAVAVDPVNDGKLVHTSARAEASDSVTDPVFGLRLTDTIKLLRQVEMFQWTEQKQTRTKTKLGGGEETVTVYTYRREWDSKMHRSSDFRKPDGHANPEPRYRSACFSAQQVSLGAFRIPDFLIEAWDDYKPHALPPQSVLPAALQSQAHWRDEWLFLSSNPDEPKVGDLRVAFQSIPEGEASVLARQIAGTFEPYATQHQTKIARIASGVQSKESMFAAAQSENTTMTWLLRGLGMVVMFLGLLSLFQPLKVVADVLPIAGRVVGAGTGMIAFLLAGIGSTATISLAWLWYRPLLGITILIATAGCFVLFARALRKKAT